MMPDSTQAEKTEKKAKKRKGQKKTIKTEKKKKKVDGKKKKKSTSFNEAEAKVNSDNEYDSDLDLNKEVKPIGAYIKKRDEMLQHMFKSIKGDKLKSMLPDIMKECSLEEIKTLCLDQLEVMSKKRIRCILTGQEMLSSSGTDDSSSDEEVEGVKKKEDSTKHPGVDDGDDKKSENIDRIDSDVVDSTTDHREIVDVTEVALSLSPQHDEDTDSLFNDVDPEMADVVSPSNSDHGNSNQGNNDKECSNKSDEAQNRQDDDDDEHYDKDGVHDNSNQGHRKYKQSDQKCPEVEIIDLTDNGDTQQSIQDGNQRVSNYSNQSNTEGANSDDNDVELVTDARVKETETPHRELGTASKPQAPVQSRLEILELEMRARAIRSLMKANEVREATLKKKKAKLE
ncbi:uncharacterized protein LOC144436718 [Glandiceps talaboti]